MSGGSGKQGGIAETWRSGYIPLQDHGFKEEGTNLRTRHMRHAVRIVGRLLDENDFGMGHYVIGEFANGDQQYGDILGGVLWENETVNISGGDREASIREIAAWSFAWPAIITEAKKGRVPKARPIFDDRLEQDDRFKPLEVVPMVPVTKGRKGIVLDSIKEDVQQQLFFPSDSQLVAHWRGKVPNDFSSLVFDVNAEGEVDEERFAPMDTAWRVSRALEPGGEGGGKLSGSMTRGLRNKFGALVGGSPGDVGPASPQDQVLAWNITASPSEQGYGMMVGRPLSISLPDTPPPLETIQKPQRGSIGDRYDKFSSGRSIGDDYGGVTITPGELALAYHGVERGGPGYVGAGPADKHLHGINADGEPIGPEHIQAAALFFATEEMDAPLEFRLEGYPGGAIFSKTVEVHLVYDDKASHPYVGAGGKVETARGLWRWVSYTPWKPCSPPIPPPQQPLVMVIPDGQSSSGAGGGQGGGGAGGGGLFPPRKTADKDNQKGAAVVRRIAPHIYEGWAHGQARIANEQERPAAVAAVETDNEICMPACSFRPQKTQLAGGNLLYADQTTIQQQDDREFAPVTMRFEAFGKQDATSITDWSYAEEPLQEDGRYLAGTAESGGACFLPANFGIEDVFGVEPPAHVVPAPTYTVHCRTTESFAQFIAPELGRPVGGFDFAQDTDGNLECTAVAADATETPVTEIHLVDGHYEHKTSTGHPLREENNSVTTSTTLDASDHTLICDNSFGSPGTYTVNLPPSGQHPGVIYQVKRVNAGGNARRVRVQPDGADQIDFAANFDLKKQFDAITVKDGNNGNWYIL